MRNVSKLSIILLISLFCRCSTDVPLSFSTRLNNDKLIGYWQSDDSSGISIQLLKDRGIQIKNYTYDHSVDKYISEGNDNSYYPYFTDLKDGGIVHNFMSFEYDKTSSYVTVKYNINKDNSLIVRNISHDYMKKYNQVSDGDIVKFGKAERFRSFVNDHIKNPQLFESPIIYYRRNDISGFIKPKRKKMYLPKATKPEGKQNSLITNESKTTSNVNYGLCKMRSRKYIKELKTWDDYSGWQILDENYNNAKFFKSGMRLKLYSDGSFIEYFGTDLYYYGEDKSTDGLSTFYIYKGKTKYNGETVGNFTLYLLNAKYSDILNGTQESLRFDIEIDYLYQNLSEKGFWSYLINGVDQIEINFRAHTK